MSIPPVPGAIAIVLTDTHVLLVQRGKQPDAGFWGFPGGHLEPGETAYAAARRELHEETGLTADPVERLADLEVLRHAPDGTVALHYVLAVVLCENHTGTLAANDDARDAAWVRMSDVRTAALPMSPRVADVMEQALIRRQARRADLRP
jgi:ADP-ribose pyrophosphatase YjhB (NUDIX family)